MAPWIIRNHVAVVGGDISSDLDGALEARDLVAIRLGSIDDATTDDPYAADVQLRTIILQSGTGEDGQAALTRALRRARHHLDLGGNVAVVTASEAAFEAADLSISHVTGAEPRVRQFDLGQHDAIKRLAQFAAAFDPGPPATRVRFSGADPGEDAILLSRAFHDFQHVKLTAQCGGSANVYRADVVDATLRCEPFIVKIDSRSKIGREIANYSDNVELHVAFPHRPTLVLSRSAAGYKRQAMVSWFASRAARLDEHIFWSSPHETITALFAGPLRTWRRMVRRGEGQIAQIYRDCQRLFDPANRKLDEVYQNAYSSDPSLHSPHAIYDALMRMPRAPLDFCYAHGDLHAANIFVRDHGHDVILIDFLAATAETLCSRDPATLEVSIAFLTFSSDKVAARLSDGVLRQLYRKDALLVGHLDDESDHRAEAVLAIRGEARKRCTSAREYDISLAIMLLGMARRASSPIAYALADGLLRDVGVL